MKFKEYLTMQLERHPWAQPEDIVKLCYQSAYGAEHLLNDRNKAKAYFYSEYASTSNANIVLYEPISPDVCRVNLSAWKNSGMPPEWLFCMFAASSSMPYGGKERLEQHLSEAEETLSSVSLHFSYSKWKSFLSQYHAQGMPAVHHSPVYREKEHPSYRIIHSVFLRLFPILQKAAFLASKNQPHILSIEGRSASGKTTMAEQLRQILGASIIHMDDFFLPLELRTQRRLLEPGGNVHYERFLKEVLPNLSKPETFSYRIFDCGKMDYNGVQEVEASQWRIVEGAYSCHPKFGDYSDLMVFSDVSSQEQEKRILARNGEKMAERFRNCWIPLEEAYFTHHQIKERCQLII